jgi:AraC-like DNA-binding protein
VAVVLDAAAHPPAERPDLVHEAIAGSGARRRVSLNAPDESVDLRVEAWRIGTAHVLRTAGTGLALTRTERDVRADAPELLAIALSYGESRYSVCGALQQLGRNGVLVVDFHTPYSFAPVGPTGSTFVTHIPYADLGLTVDEVRTAIPRLSSSPLLPLVRGHLVQMSTAMDEVTSEPGVAANLGAATIDLTRALVMSAAGVRRGWDVPRDTLRARVVAYVRAHLGERDLTPAQIAARHHISLRTLYNVWGDQDGGLVDWIIRERLEGVRRELAVSEPGSTISAVARRWGFADPAHFSRRFKAAYGQSPATWLREASRPPT